MTLQSLYDVGHAGRLSPEESAELAAHIASLAQSGLPLDSGLRALAQEIPSRSMARVLRRLAERLSAGDPFETAIQSPDSRLPAHLRGLIVAGIQNGQLPEALDEYLAVVGSRQSLRRRVVLACAYPAVTLGACALLLIFCNVAIIPQFAKLFGDFGTKLPDITQAVLEFSRWTIIVGPIVLIILLGVGIVSLLPPLRGWLASLIRWIPVFGPIVTASRVAQFSRWMAMLLERRIPLPQALRLAADGMGGPANASACQKVAEKVEKGESLSEALRGNSQFPPSTTVLLGWGEQNGRLDEAFRISAESCESRAQSQVALLEMVLPALLFLVVIGFVGMTIIALFMPLIAVVSNLSGGGGGGSSGPSDDLLVEIVIPIAIIFLLVGPLCLGFLRLTAGPPPRERTRCNLFALILGRGLIGIGLATLLYLFPISILILLWPVCAALVVAMAMNQNAKCRQNELLGLLAAAAERSLPLTPVIEAFASERRGWFRRRSLRLVKLLNEGVPLPSALEREPGVLSQEVMPMLLVGYECGNLSETLRQAAAVRNIGQSIWQGIVPKLAYVFILPSIMAGLVTFLIVMILPQMDTICKDFHMTLPPASQALLDLSRSGSTIYGLFGLLIWWTTTLLALYTLLRYAGVIRWDIPGTGWMTRRLDRAAILDTLSFAADRRQPMNQALFALARSYPKRAIRRRLMRTIDQVNAGVDIGTSLHDQGLLGSADLAVIEAATRTGNLTWAMQEAADGNRRRFAYRVQAFVQMAFPAIILGFGLVVFFVGLAVFAPLIEFINRLAPP